MTGRVILLVEDNQDDELLTIRALKKNNIANEIIVARDGVEALDYLFCRGEYAGRNVKDVPKLILLDINLPKVNGLEVLNQLRNNPLTKFVPVVILTTSSEVQDILNSYNLGANSFVQKPVDFGEFLEAAKQLGRYWLVLNQTLTTS